jgi:hypothetical protein
MVCVEPCAPALRSRRPGIPGTASLCLDGTGQAEAVSAVEGLRLVP